MKRVLFTVTNDLTYDQRMIRICTSLQANGYDVCLIGRKLPNSMALKEQPFRQKRLALLFKKGAPFYMEYNLRLFFYLLYSPFDAICAIDLDTILPCLFVSKLRNKKRVYDAHELFCEMKEIVTRPRIYRVWKWIERLSVPKFKDGYTVNEAIRNILNQDYAVNYEIIRSISVLKPLPIVPKENFIIYQGAVNEGRSFETIIPAFNFINVPLYLYGDGNFLEEAKALANKYQLEDKVLFKGKLSPAELNQITPKAILGLTIFENTGLSNYYSLANRFFDYIHGGIPQVCVNYPVYQEINETIEVAVLIDDLSVEGIARVINETLSDEPLMSRLKVNCVKARELYNWQAEEKRLLKFYNQLFA
ncbi:MAG: glycosyltransferase family 4 protein [Flaviaesturariibacter sp.]|nr:glycosyltransferase family 4 protein [Flaviaesturariibacter sp.]